VWAQVKREVAKKNETFAMAEVERLTNEELDRITQEDGLPSQDMQKNCRRKILQKKSNGTKFLSPSL
jgi:hypothetical protein